MFSLLLVLVFKVFLCDDERERERKTSVVVGIGRQCRFVHSLSFALLSASEKTLRSRTEEKRWRAVWLFLAIDLAANLIFLTRVPK